MNYYRSIRTVSIVVGCLLLSNVAGAGFGSRLNRAMRMDATDYRRRTSVSQSYDIGGKNLASIAEELAKHGFKRELANTCVSFNIKPENVVSLCQRYGINPGLVGANDITQGQYENYPEWTESGRKLVQAQQADLLKKKVGELGLVDKTEQACADLMATINTNRLLSFDEAAVNVVINSKFKEKLSDVEERLRFADIKDLRRKHEYMLDKVTNAYITLSSPRSSTDTKIGPLFLLSKNEDTIVFNKSVIEEGINQQCEEVAEVWANQYGFDSYVNELLRIDNKVPQRGLMESVEKWLKISIVIKDAKELELAERARVNQLITAYETMPESEKFPLLSVQPKPQMLMKGIPSGASIKWVQGWLLANKIEHDEPWIDKSNGNATIDGHFCNKDGIKVRTVKFRFCDDALVTLSIRLEEKPTTPDDIEKKYLKEFGSTAKAERRKGDLKLYSHQDNIMTWTRDDLIKVTTDDVGAVAMYKTFAGLVMISESTAQGLVFAGTEEKMRYMLFDKTSRADLVINADGSVIRCTKDGEILKAYAKDFLPSFAQEIDNRITEIEVWDMKLYNYMTEKEKKAKEAEAKAAEEAKKVEAAAALDF